MNRSFRLHKSDNAIKAVIPNRWIWDLVEYLALLRVQVTYTYSAQQFVVNFPHMELDQVRELLNGWAENWPGVESSEADVETRTSALLRFSPGANSLSHMTAT